VRLGLGLPQRAGVDLDGDVTRVARAAEVAGFDSLWVYERLLYPVEPSAGLYGIEGLAWPSYYEGAAAPLALLAAAAAVTKRVRLGSSVLVASLHIPVQLAKSLATIDQLSGGRLVAGLGAGWSVDELRAGGATLEQRGRDLDETLDVLAAVWGPDPVSYAGPRTVIDRALVFPKPAVRIPVLLAGIGPAALDRIARRADGWLPAGLPPVTLAGIWAGLRATAESLGRDPAAMQVIARANVDFTDGPAGADRPPFAGDLAQVVADVVAHAEAGVDELIIDLQASDGFKGGTWLLDTALEIRERAIAAGA
jgi:probable F420-dependent oxidoreductase